MARDPVMRRQVEVILSRFLGLRASDLGAPDNPISPASLEGVRFKRVGQSGAVGLAPAYTTIRRAAAIALRCLGDDVRGPEFEGVTPHILRKSILGDASYVSFEGLLDSAWEMGVPVLRVRELPTGGGNKVDGAALDIGGRQVIVITTPRTSVGYLAWIIAHEMGHIALRHLKGGSILDAKLFETEVGEDPIEDEANRFAALVVFGDEAFEPTTSYLPSGADLADLARRYGHAMRIDPAVIVTAWGRTMKQRREMDVWGIVQNALNALDARNTEGSTIRDRMRRYLSSEKVSDSDAHFLAQVTGLGSKW